MYLPSPLCCVLEIFLELVLCCVRTSSSAWTSRHILVDTIKADVIGLIKTTHYVLRFPYCSSLEQGGSWSWQKLINMAEGWERNGSQHTCSSSAKPQQFRPRVAGRRWGEQAGDNQPFQRDLYSKSVKQVPLPTGVLVLGWSALGTSYRKHVLLLQVLGAGNLEVQEQQPLFYVCLFRLLLPYSSGIWLSSPDPPNPLCHSLCISHLSVFFPASSVSLHYKHIFFCPGLLFTWMWFSLYEEGPMDINP